MKILYLAHRIPYPPNKGDKIRSFNEIKYLSQKHEIHLACLEDDLESRGLSKYERKVAEAFDHSILVTDVEAKIFKTNNPYISNKFRSILVPL